LAKTYHYYSDEEIFLIEMLIDEGRSAKYIAKCIGRPLKSVYDYCKRHGKSWRERTHVEVPIDDILYLAEVPWVSRTWLARLIGSTKARIDAWVTYFYRCGTVTTTYNARGVDIIPKVTRIVQAIEDAPRLCELPREQKRLLAEKCLYEKYGIAVGEVDFIGASEVERG
jgi:hypothetical protein